MPPLPCETLGRMTLLHSMAYPDAGFHCFCALSVWIVWVLAPWVMWVANVPFSISNVQGHAVRRFVRRKCFLRAALPAHTRPNFGFNTIPTQSQKVTPKRFALKGQPKFAFLSLLLGHTLKHNWLTAHRLLAGFSLVSLWLAAAGIHIGSGIQLFSSSTGNDCLPPFVFWRSNFPNGLI